VASIVEDAVAGAVLTHGGEALGLPFYAWIQAARPGQRSSA
jgi:hypothetical protein